MLPIFIALVIGCGISLERYLTLTSIQRINKRVWEELQIALISGNFNAVTSIINNDNSSISNIIRTGLERKGEIQHRDDIELITDANMIEIAPQLKKRTNYVMLLANASTLLGLLGTVMGLIDAFTAVAHAEPSEKADFLSTSISVAMNTTAFGLISAIILLIAYSILKSKTSQIIDSLEVVSVKTLNIITEFSQDHETYSSHEK